MNAKEYVTVTIDFATVTGRIKPLHGVNNAPVRPWKNADQHELAEAAIPFVRTHDTSGMWGGAHYVDIPNVFPDFDADENDPASYDFAFTDGYLKPIIESGAQLFYRLGVTIENFHEVKAYHIFPPKDAAKWARVCEHVVRHYNEGWADGFKWGIVYWEIWNEPENPPMWKGAREEYFELYRVASNHLKQRFPDIKVGGYGSCGFYATDPQNDYDKGEFFSSLIAWFEAFCAYVTAKDTKAPLDFFSWHLYTDDVRRIARHAEYARATLDRHGLRATESVFNEWNRASGDPGAFDEMKEAQGASFCASAFALMQQGPIDSAMYYDALPTRSYCGLFYFPSCRTTPCYESFKAFGELRGLGEAVRCASNSDDIFVIAARNGDRQAFMVSNYAAPGKEREHAVRLEISGGARRFALSILDCENSAFAPIGELVAGSVLSIKPHSVVFATAL